MEGLAVDYTASLTNIHPPREVSRSHNRRFGLDAARALAIALVVLTHGLVFLGPLLKQLGIDPRSLVWLAGIDGVELFFCLSGFLIGGLLLDIERSGASAEAIKIFLVRRWMRTLPMYYLVLIALLLVPQLDPAQHQRTWSYALLIQNAVTPMPGSGWFGPSWSLTIEEWSYLALPLIAFGVCRSARRPVLVAALILIAAGIVARLAIGLTHDVWTIKDWDSLIRKIVVVRIDAVAYGVLAAVFVRSCDARRWKYHLLAVGIFLNCTVIILTQHVELLPGPFGWFVLFPLRGVGFALLMPWLADLPAPYAFFAGPIRFLARISYCIYLVHWPIMFLTLEAVTASWRFAVFVCGSIVTAAILSYGVEYPIMRLRPRQV
jgi:peptidoglycan/LPS O-acetylase OafA/YrhL